MSNKLIELLKLEIEAIPNFPKPGVIFRDVTPLFKKPALVNMVIENFAQHLASKNIDAIVGIESRGYLFGLPLALKLNKPFILIRKPNKLPKQTYKQEFNLEYGSSTLEVHVEDIKPNWNICVVDDLLATGGTIQAAEKLVERAKAKTVVALFLIELEDLHGRENIESPVYSILKY